MGLEITKYDWSVRHRNEINTLSHLVEDQVVIMNGIRVMVAQFKSDDKWYIIAEDADDDDNMTDVGPFDDAEEAVIHMKLLGD